MLDFGIISLVQTGWTQKYRDKSAPVTRGFQRGTGNQRSDDNIGLANETIEFSVSVNIAIQIKSVFNRAENLNSSYAGVKLEGNLL